MVWSCENGNGGRSVEIRGRNGSIWGKGKYEDQGKLGKIS